MKKKQLIMLGLVMAVCMSMTACGEKAPEAVEHTQQVTTEVPATEVAEQVEASLEAEVTNEKAEVTSLEDFSFQFNNEDGTATLRMYKGSGNKVIVIPEEVEGYKVTKIGQDAFLNEEEIEEVIMPDTILELGSKAFMNCDGLTKVTLSKQLTKIGEYCFSGAHIKDFVLPDTVTFIDDSGMGNGYQSINIPAGLTELPAAFAMEAKFETFIVPSNIKIIHPNAFLQCKALKEITIEDGVEVIEMKAFSGCTALEKVTLPSTLKSLGEDDFLECESLVEITIPEGTTEIGAYAFGRCNSLQRAYVPASVTTILDHAFFDTADDFTIYTPAGSAAEAYAIEKKIPYVNQ